MLRTTVQMVYPELVARKPLSSLFCTIVVLFLFSFPFAKDSFADYYDELDTLAISTSINTSTMATVSNNTVVVENMGWYLEVTHEFDTYRSYPLTSTNWLKVSYFFDGSELDGLYFQIWDQSVPYYQGSRFVSSCDGDTGAWKDCSSMGYVEDDPAEVQTYLIPTVNRPYIEVGNTVAFQKKRTVHYKFVTRWSVDGDYEGPPFGSLIINSSDQYTNSQSVSLDISKGEGSSDPANMIICNFDDFADCEWEDYIGLKNWDLLGNDGLKTVYSKLKNAVGSESVIYSDSITLDTTGPTGSVTINSGDKNTPSRNVLLRLTGSDNYSGVSQMIICNESDFSGCSWEEYSTLKSWKLKNKEGEKTVYVKFKDSVENISTVYTDSIFLDTGAPSGSLTINQGNSKTNSNRVRLSFNGEDSGSGISQVMVCNNNSFHDCQWEDYVMEKDWDLDGGEGLKTVYVKVKDNVGMVSGVFSSSIEFATEKETVTQSSVYRTSSPVVSTNLEEEEDEEVVDQEENSNSKEVEEVSKKKYVVKVLDKDNKPVKGVYVKLESGVEGYTGDDGVVSFDSVDHDTKQKVYISYGDYSLEGEVGVLGREDEDFSGDNFVFNIAIPVEESKRSYVLPLVVGGVFVVSLASFLYIKKKRG